MLEMVITTASAILLALGAFFYLVAAIGVVRLPDIFTRMHAAGLSETMGAGLMIAGMMVAAGFSLVSAKLAIILATVLFTSPIATHALAQAAMHAGIKPVLINRRVLGLGSGRELLEPRRSRGERGPNDSKKPKSTKAKSAKAKRTAKRPASPTPKRGRSRSSKGARS